jgi:hypothetical protein
MNSLVVSSERFAMSVYQRGSGGLSLSTVGLHVARGVTVTALPVFLVLLVSVLVAVVVTSRPESLSVLFIPFEVVESAIRLFTLTSSGVIDLTDGLLVQFLIF